MIKEAELMTSFSLTPPHLLLFFLMVSGVVSQPGWGVYYRPSSICAVKESTVIFGCRFLYPSGFIFSKAFWTKELVTKDREPSNLSLDPNYTGRVQYLGDNLHDCYLSLTDVREQDQGKYYFRFLTTTPGGKYQGIKGVELFVTELQVEMISDRVVEGDKVTLTCRTTCRLSDTPKFNWYKQGHQLTLFYSFDRLVLQPVSQRDAGSYSCSINGQGYQSPEVTLDVQYPPKSVSVSISPYDEIVEGSSVTLNCSSDANPPIHSYIWYKDGSSVETGDTFIIIKVRSEDSGDYTCKAENKHGQQSSTAMSLNVLYPPKNISVSISPSDEIVKGSSVNLTCSSDANPPVHNYTWYKVDEISPVGSGQSYSFTLSSSSSGWFYCEAQNKLGSQKSTAVPLTLNEGGNVLLYVILGVIAGFGALIAIFVVLFIRRNRQSTSTDYATSGQENTHIGADLSAATNTPISYPAVVNQDDVQYASIQHRTAGKSVIQALSSETAEEVQYATVQHRCDRAVKQTQEADDLYANVRLKHSATAYSSAAPFSDVSVIYNN